MPERVHAFTDDALRDHDATALASLVEQKEVAPAELAAAAVARADAVQPLLNGVHFADYERALASADTTRDGPFHGVPTFVKDNVDVAGMPTNHGTAAFTAKPTGSDGPFVTQFRSLGFTLLGKSRLPEFGFSASTEYTKGDPVRNPWNTDYSAGASSGGSAALAASGVVPVAHANDGGGSIRIPAAACGLVGLKPTRGRFVLEPNERAMPVNIVGQGILTRTVRDTARFFAGMEAARPARRLPPVRRVQGPSATRLRVGVVLDSVTGTPTDAETRRTVEEAAALLASLGHEAEEMALPVSLQFAEDFALYWGLLGFAISTGGRRALGPDFDVTRTDNLTRGLAASYRRQLARTPGMVLRLRRSTREYRRAFADRDVILSPVLGHTTPLLGHLSPTLEFEELFHRLRTYVGFTPLNNVAGGPAMSLPLGMSEQGLPIGVHFSADLGDERTLLELAYELEAARPFARIQG
jgi:amidase